MRGIGYGNGMENRDSDIHCQWRGKLHPDTLQCKGQLFVAHLTCKEALRRRYCELRATDEHRYPHSALLDAKKKKKERVGRKGKGKSRTDRT